MNNDEYLTTVNGLLQDPSTYRRIRKDPANAHNDSHEKLLKKLKEDKQISEALYYKLRPNHPRPPYARATIKIHKNPMKARLLVCSRDSVFYNTAQYFPHLAQQHRPSSKIQVNSVRNCGIFKTPGGWYHMML
ncbi:hypothetical protein SNE40_014254 [Patella caerulea]|uniref:Uncharacterized protein n=1 Tax=Patella caerulea TaxID=87958 RepID=A0AAN8JDS0_PATCE